jgi:hypothetical protein
MKTIVGARREGSSSVVYSVTISVVLTCKLLMVKVDP